jgi:hypothetical protein
MKKAKEAAVQYQTETMTVKIDAELLERLRQAAEWKGITLEEAAQEAALDYFYQYSDEKVAKEQIAFEQMRPGLLKKYRGQYVAIHNGEVVAHASDLTALTQKVFVRYGHTPMLRIQVTTEPLPAIKTHGLRFVRNDS